MRFMLDGLSAWRDGLATMTDEDLDTVGRSAYAGGLDPQLPLMDIVWWVNKELVFHSGEIWFARDLLTAPALSRRRDYPRARDQTRRLVPSMTTGSPATVSS